MQEPKTTGRFGKTKMSKSSCVAQAKVHHDKGEYAEAIPYYDKLLSKDSKNVSLLQLRGEAKVKVGRYDEGIQDLNEAIILNPKSDYAWAFRGAAKRVLDRNEEAIQDLNEAIRLNSKNDWAWARRGAAKYVLEHYEEAIKDCDEAIKLNAKNDYAWAQRGIAKHWLGRYEEAIQDCSEAIKLNSKNDWAWGNRGTSKYMLGRYEEVIQDCDEAIRLNSNNDWAWVGRGAAKFALGHYEEAIQDCNEAIRLDSKNEWAWENRGLAKRKLGRHDEAIQDLNEAIRLDPKSDLALAHRGEVKRLLGSYEEALQDLNEAIRLNPKNEFASKELVIAKEAQQKRLLKNSRKQQAKVYYDTGEYAEAISSCDKMLAEDSRDVFLLQLRGESKRALSRHDEAILDFDEVIKLDSKNGVAWLRRGEAKQKLNHHEEAIQDCDEAIRLNPRNDLAWISRGESKRALGRYKEAIQDCDEAMKLNSKNEIAWMCRGESKFKLGRYGEAIEDLMEVVRLSPENIYAKECLKEARRKLKDQPQSSASKLNSQPQDSPVFSHTIKFSMAISKEHLSFERRLGEGSFGEVHKGIWSPTSLFKVPVAIKKLKNASLSSKSLEEFRREVEIQAKLNSVGVVKLLGITSEQPYCMVMEFMEQGSLRDVLDSQKPEELHWSVRIQMAVNMAQGLAYLHAQNPVIIHGDLKSLNILVNSKGEAKLADFGLAALKTETRSKEYVGGDAGKNKGPKGSLLWIAPELFRMNARRTTATDIFSLAVVFWELASHLFPYESAEGNEGLIREWVTTGEREAFDERTPNTPKEYIDLTQRCWDAKSENRPNAETVVVELENIYSSTPLAPTMFSSGSRVSPNPVRRQSMNSGGYMANTGSGPVPVKSSSEYLVESVVPSSQSPTGSPKVPPERSLYMGNMYK